MHSVSFWTVTKTDQRIPPHNAACNKSVSLSHKDPAENAVQAYTTFVHTLLWVVLYIKTASCSAPFESFKIHRDGHTNFSAQGSQPSNDLLSIQPDSSQTVKPQQMGTLCPGNGRGARLPTIYTANRPQPQGRPQGSPLQAGAPDGTHDRPQPQGRPQGRPQGSPLQAGAPVTPMADRNRKGRPYRRVPTMTPMTDRNRKGDRKGRPCRRVPPMTPMADRTGNHKGDPVGAPLAGAPGDTHDRPQPAHGKIWPRPSPLGHTEEAGTQKTEFLPETRFLNVPSPPAPS